MDSGLGKRIKKRRTDLGLTQGELAARMGYKSKAAICKVENGEDNITTDRISKFANALDVTPAYLIGWEDEDGNPIEVEMDVKMAFDPSAYRKDFLQKAVSYYSKVNRLPSEYQAELDTYLEYLQTRADSHQTK